MKIKAIAAVALNGVIGDGLNIPWHISEDFKHFKKTTTGHVVVMGRKTWQSLGEKPLPGRENAVITSNPSGIVNARAFCSLEECLKAYKGDDRTLWICGGAALYRAALPVCDELILTRVKFSPRGDVFFPKINHLFKKTKTLKRRKLFNVVKYVSRNKSGLGVSK